MMISASYKKNEFFRCSYFVYNNIIDERYLTNEGVDINYVYWTFLTDKPRIIVWDINWEMLNRIDHVEEL